MIGHPCLAGDIVNFGAGYLVLGQEGHLVLGQDAKGDGNDGEACEGEGFEEEFKGKGADPWGRGQLWRRGVGFCDQTAGKGCGLGWGEGNRPERR